LPDYNALVNIIKQAGLEATKADKPVNVCYGKVTSISPLRILVDQKITLGSAQLTLTRNVTDYDVEITLDEWETEKSEEQESSEATNETESSEGTQPHTHKLKGKKKMKVHNALKKDEKVLLLRVQGGQKYIVIDRVVKKT